MHALVWSKVLCHNYLHCWKMIPPWLPTSSFARQHFAIASEKFEEFPRNPVTKRLSAVLPVHD